jgi:septum formation inhibitor-activating ATPase MinD
MIEIGDLVKHIHLGGVGIILEKRNVVSNITMGTAIKYKVQWLASHREFLTEGFYFPAFLEVIE